MKELLKTENWAAGLQWFFFIFTNTVVIPVTIGAAFELGQNDIVALIRLSFVTVGLAGIIQAFLGHRRAIMEGQSGLWWGVLLTLAMTSSEQGISLSTLGGSLAVGMIISGILTILIGLSGAGYYLAKLFNPGVMGVFMFLFGVKLIGIFFKGMLGIPFSNDSGSLHIDLSVSLLSIIIVILVIVINIKAPPLLSRYALLIGIIIGWIAYALVFHSKGIVEEMGSFHLTFFPLGNPVWNMGIIVTAVLTGLLNMANTFGALKGTEGMYGMDTSKREYRASFTTSGVFVSVAGMFGLVPFAPYVSSIGFLSQTGILRRLPFVLGGLMFVVMGIIPAIGRFFSLLPLSIGSAVLFVSYLQLLNASWGFFKKIKFNMTNVYRSALPLFVGMTIMTFPASFFETIPGIVRPFLSSGLLDGIILALILENVFPWDRYGTDKRKESNVKS